MRNWKRLVAILLAIMLPVLAVAETTPTDVTPVATERTATEAPTAQPTTAPTEEPTETPTTAPTEEPTETPTAAPTEEPTETPTAAPTEEPTTTPSAEPTEEPEETPTAAPTEEPTEAPTESVTPAPTEDVWDEALCDHANEHCAQAPACEKEGCTHIARDVHGLDVPLCKLGRWLLDRQDELQRSGAAVALYAANQAVSIDLDAGDATIYRSGSYTVKGGSKRPGAKLSIADERLVDLDLRSASVDEMTLGKQAETVVQTIGQCVVNHYSAGQNSRTEFAGGGAMRLGEVRLGTEGSAGRIYVTGGSVLGSFAEGNGRVMEAFPAAEMTGTMVEGRSYAANRADDDGNCYLWLKNPGEGMKWIANLNAGVLNVEREATAPSQQTTEIVQGQETVLEQAGTYRLSGSVEDGTKIVVRASGVTVVLDGVAGNLAEPLLTAENDCTVTLKGTNTLSGAAAVTGSGRVLLSGSGTAVFAAIETKVTFSCGGATLDNVPQGYTSLEVPVTLVNQQVTVDGTRMALVKTADGQLILPEAGSGYRWTVNASDAEVAAKRESVDSARFELQKTPQVTTDEAKFVVDGAQDFVDGTITSTAANAAITLRQVKIETAGAALTISGAVKVTTEGDNALLGGESSIKLMDGASLTLSARSGRTRIRQNDLTGITLEGNVKVEPEPAQKHTKILVTDQSGNPVINRALTLTVDGKTYQYTTHYDGSVYLWGQGAMDGTDLAATDGDTVFAAVIVGGSAQATERIDITGVTVEDQADGSIRVRFSAQAGTTGVMFVTGDAAQNLPDTFAADATLIPAENGEAVIRDVPAGKTVSLRVYAAKDEGAVLNGDTVDGFSFSDLVTAVHRGPFSAGKTDLNLPYTGKPYKNPLTLPKGAKIAYIGKQLSDGMPLRVGDYTMKITVPEGDAVYLPGVYELPFKIERVTLTIIPDPNQEKLQGEEDPELFTYTVKGLLFKDKVDGWLTREEGEEPGNYAFRTDELVAADYYKIRLAGDAYTFTIVPAIPAWGGGGVVLRPVRQTIVRADKREVAVVLNTQDSLNVTHSRFGQIVFATEDGQQRPFNPSLSWNQSTDEVLLRIRTEAEINKDGGFKTDADGNALWSGRYLSMGWAGVRQMHDIGVDMLSLNCNGAALNVRLEDLLGDGMQALVKAKGGSLKEAFFRLTLEPVEASDAAREQQALDAVNPVTRAWRVQATVSVKQQETDITGMLPSLWMSVDMRETEEMMQSLDRYDEQSFPGQFTLYQVREEENGYAGTALESRFVKPYMPEETEQAGFAAVMYTHDYLMAKVDGKALITVGWTEN